MSARISHLSHHLCASSSPIEKSGGLRIRQVALVVENLEKSIEEFSKALQLNATEVGSFRDPHIYILGLRNCVFNIGDQFLELVCPEDKDNTAYKQIQRRKGDGGYMVMLQTSNLLQDEERLSKDGFKTVLNVDLNEIKEIHLHPKQTSNCVVSLSQPDFPENWHWGGPNWRKNSPSPKSKQVLGVIIQSDNILKTIEQYQKLLNMQAKQISEDEYIFAINSIQNLKIQKAKDGRGDGLYGIEVEAARPEYANSTITVCGLVVRFL